MTKEKKLKKIIEYAVERGYDIELSGSGNVKIFNGKEKAERIVASTEFIFSHDLAKAVFGEALSKTKIITRTRNTYNWNVTPPEIVKTTKVKYKTRCGRSWRHHLREAVISKDPTDYYYQYIKNGQSL